jgi:hypothetical protein
LQQLLLELSGAASALRECSCLLCCSFIHMYSRVVYPLDVYVHRYLTAYCPYAK